MPDDIAFLPALRLLELYRKKELSPVEATRETLRRLGLMKPGALLINIGRARIVDEEALYAALRDGGLGGAALDVW